MNVGNCTLVLTLLSRLDEIYFDQYGSIMARFADIQSISEVIDTPAVIFFLLINIYQEYQNGIVARLDKMGAMLTAMESPVDSTDGYYGVEDWTYDGIVLESYPGVEYGPAASSHDCEDVKSVLEVKSGSSCKLKEIYLLS